MFLGAPQIDRIIDKQTLPADRPAFAANIQLAV